jgi:DNA-nicking Smr family endonuclease
MTGGRSGRTRKGSLSDEDRALWDDVTRSIKPLRRSAKSAAPPADAAVEDEGAAKGKPPARKPSVPLPVRNPPAAKPAPPPLAPLGRRQRGRIARGGTDIDARLDLHGLTQDQAHAKLLRFLRVAQANDARLLLVITGKGARGGEDRPAHERGVLKRMVPQWLSLPEFRSLVVGFESAHVAHGGEGALYVRVRRGR